MSLTLTILLMTASLTLAVLAHVMQNKPKTSFEPSLIPWTFVQMAAIVLVLMLAAHLVSLLTGSPLKSRFLG